MKKILLMIAAVAMFCVAVSCGNDGDEPRHGDGVFTVNTPMVNHIVIDANDQVVGVSATHNKLILDTIKHTASVELGYNNNGTDKTYSLKDLTAKAQRLGYYVLSSASDPKFSGYVDFNEGSLRYRYVTPEGLRIISTTSEVFFLKTMNTVTYDDTTKTTQIENTMYQFTIEPRNQTAMIKVMGIVHAKDMKYFNSITANSVPFTVTPTGYAFDAEDLKTTGIYRNYVDSTGATFSTTDKYPFKTFNATVDMVNDHIDAHYMIGASATVNATGRTYPDYPSY